MIDETLVKLVENCHGIVMEQFLSVVDKNPAFNKALTAIYEIGLGVIGKNGRHKHSEFCNRPCDDDYEEILNDLRASQRKAWAKACGVKG